ncbi:response regulator [Ornithinimicrobium tianjinense]|uniref:DNA-binding response regulator n=1 Tax=Ornithinimicrobium tianjinense TaxID=1195761 RepID=A0A917BY00_9MICO|nr:response regulator transcription factor [Ornithinimicrobium tianjinense]GGF60664.1 DNA-binding response regulator [Ornithinimicrobium tianjinense]
MTGATAYPGEGVPVRVLVVDDHPVVRAGLSALLGVQPGLQVVGEAGGGEEAIRLAAELGPDVILCDLRLGEGPDGVAVTRAVRARPAAAPAVLILTTYDHDADLVRAVEAGAAGYLLKDAAPTAIVAAIGAAARGETLLGPELTERVVTTMRVRRAELSARELEVLRLVADGLSNREVARRLVVSEATVKTHLNHVFVKLGAESRTAAVAAARAAGLLE